MNLRLLKLTLLIALAFTSIQGSGQILDPVDWKFSSEQSSDGGQTLVFKAIIENKWHLYSQSGFSLL